MSLQDFLATSTTAAAPAGSTQVSVQKYSSWADECDEDDELRPSRTEIIQLPTAPRAARILDDDSIPLTGPFIAHISNLPYDSNEQDIDEFFVERDIHVKVMRLARDDTNDRLRGHGHVEFETREDLINAVMLTDTNIRNRRIRIAVSSEAEQRDGSGRTVRKRFDNYSARDPTTNESTNWRDRKESSFEPVEQENRRSYQSRPTFQSRHDNNNNSNEDSGGNWRMGERPVNDSPPPERRRFGGDRDRDNRDNRDRRGGNRYERNEREQELPQERPKINLQPRTLPLPELHFPKEEELDRPPKKPSSMNGDRENHNDSRLPEDSDEKEITPVARAPKPKVPSENIFGQAKPVDTAARERAIEEKLEQERIAKQRASEEEREKERLEAESEKNVPVEPKKEMIIIRTRAATAAAGDEETNNWRIHDEPSNNGSVESRNRDGGGRRYVSPNRRPMGRSQLKQILQTKTLFLFPYAFFR